jgi:hypothetical protein
MGGKPLDDSAKLCGASVDTIRGNLCKTAESSDELEFLAKECEAQALVLAKAQCAGRRYTGVVEKYRGFCSNFSNLMDKGGSDTAPAAEPATPAEKTKGLFNKGKKALGGLL